MAGVNLWAYYRRVFFKDGNSGLSVTALWPFNGFHNPEIAGTWERQLFEAPSLQFQPSGKPRSYQANISQAGSSHLPNFSLHWLGPTSRGRPTDFPFQEPEKSSHQLCARTATITLTFLQWLQPICSTVCTRLDFKPRLEIETAIAQTLQFPKIHFHHKRRRPWFKSPSHRRQTAPVSSC